MGGREETCKVGHDTHCENVTTTDIWNFEERGKEFSYVVRSLFLCGEEVDIQAGFCSAPRCQGSPKHQVV